MKTLSGFQQIWLVVLRTAIGWHFAYEGFYKLMLPGWTRSGERIAAFSAAGYLSGATGPLASAFRSMASHPAVVQAVDVAVPIGLLLVGLSLMLGLFTQLGCIGALVFLGLFYLSQPPLTGLPMPGAEGENLIVNKNLIEFFAVLAVFSFRTGRVAGLDRLRMKPQTTMGVASVGVQRP